MARNTLAGKGKGRYNEDNGRDYEYDKAYQKKRVKYRTELNRENRKRKTYGNKDGKDLSHTKKKGKLVKEKARNNRARNGHNGKSTKK